MIHLVSVQLKVDRKIIDSSEDLVQEKLIKYNSNYFDMKDSFWLKF